MSFNARIYLRGTYPPKGRLGAGGGCMLLRSDASTCARSDYDPTVPIRVACRAARGASFIHNAVAPSACVASQCRRISTLIADAVVWSRDSCTLDKASTLVRSRLTAWTQLGVRPSTYATSFTHHGSVVASYNLYIAPSVETFIDEIRYFT